MSQFKSFVTCQLQEKTPSSWSGVVQALPKGKELKTANGTIKDHIKFQEQWIVQQL